MKRIIMLNAALMFSFATLVACAPTATPTPLPLAATPTATKPPTPIPSATPTGTPTATPTIAATKTPTVTPTPTRLIPEGYFAVYRGAFQRFRNDQLIMQCTRIYTYKQIGTKDTRTMQVERTWEVTDCSVGSPSKGKDSADIDIYTGQIKQNLTDTPLSEYGEIYVGSIRIKAEKAAWTSTFQGDSGYSDHQCSGTRMLLQSTYFSLSRKSECSWTQLSNGNRFRDIDELTIVDTNVVLQPSSPIAFPTSMPVPTSLPTAITASTPTATRATTLQTTPATVVLPLPTGHPVSSWNDIPIMPQAISGNEEQGVYSYTVKATVQQVQDFYDKEMAKAGWRPYLASTGLTSTKIVTYQKEGKTSYAIINDQGEIVVVMLVLK